MFVYSGFERTRVVLEDNDQVAKQSNKKNKADEEMDQFLPALSMGAEVHASHD